MVVANLSLFSLFRCLFFVKRRGRRNRGVCWTCDSGSNQSSASGNTIGRCDDVDERQI